VAFRTATTDLVSGGDMRAMLSDGGRIPATLKPHLYESDRRWLALTAEDEARAVMAVAEPEGSGYQMRAAAALGWGPLEALSDALAAFVGGGQ
jgi:hypothetical protein